MATEQSTVSILEYSNDIADATPPVPLPAGTYRGTIMSAEMKTSANTGNQYIAVGFHINADQYPLDFVDGDPEGTKLYYNRVTVQDTTAGRWRIRKFMETIGATMTGGRVDLSAWINLSAMVVIKNGEYNGEPRAEISNIEKDA